MSSSLGQPRALTLAIAASLALASSPSAAKTRRAKPKLLAKVDLSLRRPTFVRARRLRPVDRGQRLWIGSGLGEQSDRLHLLRVADGTTQTVTVPLEAYRRAAADRARLRVDTLVSYDSAHRVAGVLLRERYARGKPRRIYFARWDLKTATISGALELSRHGPGRARVLAVGYDHVTQRTILLAYQALHRASASPGPASYKVEVMALDDKLQRTSLASYEASRAPSRCFLGVDARLLLLTEYAEKASAGPAPQGRLLRLDSGSTDTFKTKTKTKTFEIPLTTYGAVLGKERLYLYSSQLGELWTLDATSGRRLATLKVGRRGHALGRLDDKTLLLIRAAGLRWLHLRGKRLRKGRLFPMTRLAKPILNVSGSRVTGGRALIRRSRNLLVVAPNG